MLTIKKLKKIIIILAVLILCIVSILLFRPYYTTQSESYVFDKTLEGKRILLDAGHGGFDPGSIGNSTGVKESKLNLEVTRFLHEELTNRGAKVSLTRAGHGALATNKRKDMQRRQEMIESPEFDICISIHMNKFTSSAPNGPMVFYYKDSLEGEILAQMVQDALNKDIDSASERTAKTGDYMVLRSGDNICILVECGFLSNPNDELLLQSSDHQKRIARAITRGVESYFNNLPERENDDAY